MKINLSFKKFKNNHSKKKHQILFRTKSFNQYYKVENLFRFLLAEKDSFIFESVEKGSQKGRYSVIGLKPDLIWECKNNICKFKDLNISSKSKILKTNPLDSLKTVSYTHLTLPTTTLV